jgi:hypothetical protein
MKIIIAGGRDFNNYEELERVCDFYLQNQKEIEIVNGKGDGGFVDKIKVAGADKLAEDYAIKKGYKITFFPANWNKFGKSAGPRRNKQMADYCGAEDGLIAFWDKKSRGTKNMIELAKEKGMKIKIHFYNC